MASWEGVQHARRPEVLFAVRRVHLVSQEYGERSWSALYLHPFEASRRRGWDGTPHRLRGGAQPAGHPGRPVQPFHDHVLFRGPHSQAIGFHRPQLLWPRVHFRPRPGDSINGGVQRCWPCHLSRWALSPTHEVSHKISWKPLHAHRERRLRRFGRGARRLPCSAPSRNQGCHGTGSQGGGVRVLDHLGQLGVGGRVLPEVRLGRCGPRERPQADQAAIVRSVP
mmetsp:Transcript_27900/g.61060  ORF Transcript_27900/g.61060 Transcript_27900/m.61060 type:complete len:224 (-) Transcript_27900:588-1259(-)